LLEHPRKVTTKVYELGTHLNVQPDPPVDNEIAPEEGAHPLLASSHLPAMYFQISQQSGPNPWDDANALMLHVRQVFHSGYISQSPFLRGHIAVLVGKSALAASSFGEVVRTGTRMRNRAGADVNPGGDESDSGDEGRGHNENTNERSPASWALEMMNLVIPPLTFWHPKQASVHLMQGLFSVAYSTHTSETLLLPDTGILAYVLSVSAICGIVGVITSCTKLIGHLRAVEAIAGIDEDRRRSMQVW